MPHNKQLRSHATWSQVLTIMLLLLAVSEPLYAQSFLLDSKELRLSAQIGATSAGQVYLRTAGRDSVTVYASIIGTNASAFTVDAARKGLGILPSDSNSYAYGSFEVTFTPSAIQTYSASLVLTDGNSTRDTIRLTGEGALNPLQLDTATFSTIYVGEGICATFKISNTNVTGNMIVTDLLIAGGSASPFTYQTLRSSLPDTLKPGDIMYVQVCFKPIKAGQARDSLLVQYTNQLGQSKMIGAELLAYAIANYRSCLTIEGDSSAFGPIPNGTTQTRTFHLKNTHGTHVSVEYLIDDSDHFNVILPKSWPIALDSQQVADVTIKFKPGNTYTNSEYVSPITFWARSGNDTCSNALSLVGFVSNPSNTLDTTLLLLAPDSTETVQLTATDRNTFQIVRVYNNSGVNEKIVSVSMQDGRYLSASIISPDSTLPFILPSGGTMLVEIVLTDSTKSTYTDTLVITTTHAITSLKYAVHATRLHQGVSIVSQQHATLLVNPNPAHGSLTVDLGSLKNADIEVLDLLGRVIASEHITGTRWMWNGSNPAGALAPNGAYVIRATGRNASGSLVTLSSRVVISR